MVEVIPEAGAAAPLEARPPRRPEVFPRVVRAVEWALIGVASAALGIELTVLFANMVARVVFDAGFTWATEVGELAITFITFLGAAAAYRRSQHMAIRVLVNRLPDRGRAFAEALVEWAVLAISVLLMVLAAGTLGNAARRTTVVLEISDVWPTLALVAGTGAIALFAAARLAAQRLATVLLTGLVAGAAVLLLAWFHANYLVGSDVSMMIGGGAFVLLLLLGVPIGFVFGAAALVYAYLVGTVQPASVALNALSASQSVLLLAVPIFLLAGDIMTRGGLTRPLAEFVSMLIVRIRGGLAQVAVVTMYIFGGVSGSQLGDVAAVGRAMEHMFDRERFPRPERAAVLAAGAAMGQTIPPSIGLLVLASATTLSVGALFLAGIVPAGVIALCLITMIFFRSPPRTVTERYRPRQVAGAAVRSVPAGLVPVIIVGGIVTGFGTPTEASSLAVVYALLLTFLYRYSRPRDIVHLLREASLLAGMLLFIISTAATFSEAMTLATIPQRLGGALGDVTGEAWLFLLICVPVLILLGAVLEGLPAILVLAPILMPVAVGYGIDELQFGILLLTALGVGAFAPPIGIGMYTACAVTGTTMEQVFRPMLPYLITLFVGLLLVAFVPFFSTWLPGVFGLGN
jgi:tripartite ATP-independent transporter DctM subunit